MPPPSSDQASAPASHTYQFDDLHLGVGHYFQIEAPSSQEPLIGHLIGFLKGVSLIVRIPAANHRNGSYLEEGDPVKIKGFSGKVAYIFNSTVKKRRSIPFPYFHIEFPAAIQGVEVRRAIRVKSDFPATADRPELKIQAAEAMLSNISTSGAQLRTSENLGEAGDSVTVNFTIPTMDYIEQEIRLKTRATIRSVTRLETPVPTYCYGLQFEGMEAMETLMLQNLVQHFLLSSPGALA